MSNFDLRKFLAENKEQIDEYRKDSRYNAKYDEERYDQRFKYISQHYGNLLPGRFYGVMREEDIDPEIEQLEKALAYLKQLPRNK